MEDNKAALPASEVVTPVDASSEIPVVETQPKDWPSVVEAGVLTIAEALRERQDQQHEAEMYRLRNDRGILLVVGVPLLGLIGFMCYLIAEDRMQAASQILYPLISAMFGFVFGYFAAVGKRGASSR